MSVYTEKAVERRADAGNGLIVSILASELLAPKSHFMLGGSVSLYDPPHPITLGSEETGALWTAFGILNHSVPKSLSQTKTRTALNTRVK
jgi:hypothetical protein